MKRILLSTVAALGFLFLGFVAYVLYTNRPLPANEFDLPILERTLVLLADGSRWSKQGDRNCSPDDEGLSLYCALQEASLEIAGEFHHRAASLQAVRHAIDAVRPDADYAHRLMDFNNSPSTSFEDVHEVIRRAMEELNH